MCDRLPTPLPLCHCWQPPTIPLLAIPRPTCPHYHHEPTCLPKALEEEVFYRLGGTCSWRALHRHLPFPPSLPVIMPPLPPSPHTTAGPADMLGTYNFFVSFFYRPCQSAMYYHHLDLLHDRRAAQAGLWETLRWGILALPCRYTYHFLHMRYCISPLCRVYVNALLTYLFFAPYLFRTTYLLPFPPGYLFYTHGGTAFAHST